MNQFFRNVSPPFDLLQSSRRDKKFRAFIMKKTLDRLTVCPRPAAGLPLRR
jgi:hypothetical protein